MVSTQGKTWMANTQSVNVRLARGQLHRLVRCIHRIVSESNISSNAVRLGVNSSGLHLSMSL